MLTPVWQLFYSISCVTLYRTIRKAYLFYYKIFSLQKEGKLVKLL